MTGKAPSPRRWLHVSTGLSRIGWGAAKTSRRHVPPSRQEGGPFRCLLPAVLFHGFQLVSQSGGESGHFLCGDLPQQVIVNPLVLVDDEIPGCPGLTQGQVGSATRQICREAPGSLTDDLNWPLGCSSRLKICVISVSAAVNQGCQFIGGFENFGNQFTIGSHRRRAPSKSCSYPGFTWSALTTSTPQPRRSSRSHCRPARLNNVDPGAISTRKSQSLPSESSPRAVEPVRAIAVALLRSARAQIVARSSPRIALRRLMGP